MKRRKIAVIGSGIGGLSCAWLLSTHHDVTLVEKDDRFGGHSNTVDIDINGKQVPVDTGFIVYNPPNYPNLVAFFAHLDVPVMPTDMSFAVSLDDGRVEYNGDSLGGMFVQRRNLFSPSYLGMLRDILRFYRLGREIKDRIGPDVTLGHLLEEHGFGQRFVREHLLPMGAAIWSTPMEQMLDYPAAAFLQFCDNHGLLQVSDRPPWYTVDGGSRVYVDKVVSAIRQSGGQAVHNRAVRSVHRDGLGVTLRDRQGEETRYDDVVFACHADQALELLGDADHAELSALQQFGFTRNRAILHSDPNLLPRNRKAWASWCYLGRTGDDAKLSVSYYMNRLQQLPTDMPVAVTLNPYREPAPGTVHASFLYDHPVFGSHTGAARQQTWALQGHRNSWYCGAWLGYGFHEDGIQAGLAVAEAIGGVRRPWNVANESGRLDLPLDFRRGPAAGPGNPGPASAAAA